MLFFPYARCRLDGYLVVRCFAFTFRRGNYLLNLWLTVRTLAITSYPCGWLCPYKDYLQVYFHSRPPSAYTRHCPGRWLLRTSLPHIGLRLHFISLLIAESQYGVTSFRGLGIISFRMLSYPPGYFWDFSNT
jgi:hypothetical protein